MEVLLVMGGFVQDAEGNLIGVGIRRLRGLSLSFRLGLLLHVKSVA